MVFKASVNSAEIEIVASGVYGIADSRIYKPDRCTEGREHREIGAGIEILGNFELRLRIGHNDKAGGEIHGVSLFFDKSLRLIELARVFGNVLLLCNQTLEIFNISVEVHARIIYDRSVAERMAYLFEIFFVSQRDTLALFGLTEQADKLRKIVVRVGFYELDALGIMERAHIIAGLFGNSFQKSRAVDRSVFVEERDSHVESWLKICVYIGAQAPVNKSALLHDSYRLVK